MSKRTSSEMLRQLQEQLAEILGQREDLARRAEAVKKAIAALENLADIEARQAATRGEVGE